MSSSILWDAPSRGFFSKFFGVERKNAFFIPGGGAYLRNNVASPWVKVLSPSIQKFWEEYRTHIDPETGSEQGSNTGISK